MLFFSGRRSTQSYDFSVQGLAYQLITSTISSADAIDKLQKGNEKFINSSDFTEAIQSLGRSSLGYYGWTVVRHFLFEYEQHLLDKSKSGREKLTWVEFTRERFSLDYKTIEHVYPQRASHPYWKEKFSQFSLKERNLLRNSIGNLVPLSQRKNSSLSNKSFQEKKGSAENPVGFTYGCYSEIEVAQCVDWTAKEIIERGIKLLKFMEIRWGVKLGTDADKVMFLGLDFAMPKTTKK